MASAEVLMAGGVGFDVTRLATFLAVPDEDITALTSIAEDCIASVLQAIAAKANEFDELRADKLRVDVELEQSVRTADSRVKSMKGQLDSALVETQELRLRASNIETARAALENDLANYKTSRTSVDEEARVLRVRVQTLESDKRDTLDALDRKSTECDKLQEEYTAAQLKNIDTRKELGSLETKLQQAESAQSNAKFRVQSLEQEVEMIKRNNEWLDNELKTKVSEHQKFRKEKAAQVSSLNSELDEAVSNVEMMKRSMESLKERYEDISKKAEDRLTKIKDLQSSAATQEENFRKEISTQKRLAELYEKSMKTSQARVAEVDKLMEQDSERLSVELGQAQAVLETESAEREAAEKRVSELEVEVERLEAELSAYASGAAMPIAAASPQGSVNGISTPVRRPGSAMSNRATPGSAMFSPVAARLQKAGVSITQLYSDYNQLKANYEAEKRRNTKLEGALEELVRDLEEKAPEMLELREEHARMEKDLVEMSKLLEDASKDRDQARKEGRKLTAKIGDFEREAAILRQQLRDLSTQIQVLVVEIEQRDAGAEQMTAHQNRVYEEIVNGNLTVEGQNDTDHLITQRLTVFRNVQEMQIQNAELLKAIRELGARMEREEKDRLKDKKASDDEEIIRLEAELQRIHDEMRNIALKSQTFVRERDMFRRMLQNKGELTQDGQPISPAPPASDAGSIAVAEMQQNLGEVLRNLQSQYDHFKTEALQNQNIINEQNRRLANERSELEIQVARINSQLEMASERYEMLSGNFTMVKSENQELQKRLTYMHESQAKQDLKTQQAAEELVDNNSMLESMRTENANLKAEKTLWKSIELRLSQDNESLTQERARLNGLISNLQSIQSEHERTDSEARRRLVSQGEKLENELQAIKRRLSEEMEQSKKNFTRKEIDQKEAQRRYDELNASYAIAKEELVAAKTSRDHLQTRVNELTLDLKVVEEKLAVYQDKPAVPASNEEDEDSVVDELRIEAADLKKELEIRNREVEDLKEQVERFKAFSMANEEQLEELQISYDQFKESMDGEITQRENALRELESRLGDMSTGLTSVNQELSEARQSELEKLQQFENEKSIFESQLNILKEDLEKSTTTAQYHQDDLRRQAGIAQEAQQNYERELVKHADAARALQILRAEYAELKNEVHSVKTDADTAKATLSFNQSSWETQREHYEKELGDVKTRCNDLVKQNKILLGQFDSVSDQIATLQKERAYADEAMEGTPEGQSLDKSMDDLREVVRYLRQEKEIVDVQYELSLQENKRVKQQLDYARNQLDETKIQLSAEQRKQTDQIRGATEHKEILEKISELNILRESNSTLRFDGERKAKKVVELATKIEELEAKIQPLEQVVRELEAEKEVKDAQMRLLNEDNERWKARIQQILQGHDRVDPAELEELKQKAATLETERDELQQKLEAADSEKDSQLGQWRNKMAKLRDDANGKIGNMRTKSQELIQEVESLRQKLEEATKAREQATADGGEELQRIRLEKERLEGEVKTLQERATTAETQSNGDRAKAQQFYKELNQFKQEKQQALNELQSLRTELGTVKAQLESVKAQEKALTEQLAANNVGINPVSDVDNSAWIEAEVQKRIAEIQSQLAQPIDALPVENSQAVEAEVLRRVSEIEANVEAEVLRRVKELRSADVEDGEVTDATTQPIPTPVDIGPTHTTTVVAQLSEEEIEARVSARVEQVLPSIIDTRVAEREKAVNERIKIAKSKFQDYKAAAVKAAIDDLEAKHKVAEETHRKHVSELEAEVSKLKIEVDELKTKISELESRPAVVTARETGIMQEDLDNALAAKNKEHQDAIAALQANQKAGDFEESKEALRVEIQAEILAIQANVDEAAEAVPEGSAAVNKEKEKLKAVISRNVEHRLGKEKERWVQDMEAQRESLIEDKVQAILKEKLVELETKMQEKEIAFKAEVEKSKDAIRQEGAMRSKVLISTLERRNKALEDKLKASEGGVQAPPVPAAPGHLPPLPQTALRRPSQIGTLQPNTRPKTPPTPAQIQAAQQAAIAAAEQAITAGSPLQQQQQQQQQQRRDNQGTGPGALRQLRGALVGSGIPRGGMAARGGRGGHQQQPGSQAGSQAGSPQQAGQAPPLNPFSGIPSQIPATGIPNPFSSVQQQQQPPQGRGGGIPRGRGGFGRGRGGQQQIQTIGTQPVVQGAGSPTGGRMNPGARQFVPPGNKRGREGGEDEGAGEGKRARSSMGGPVTGA